MASDQPSQPAPAGAHVGTGADAPHTQGETSSRRPAVKYVGEGAAVQDDDDDEEDDDAEDDLSDDDDDDDEEDEEDESDTYIALPDGPVASADIENPLVSRIGGPPAFLPLRTLPPFPATTLCPNPACAQPMELLLQIFAPREESPYDRCLHVWGCARRACNAPRTVGQPSTGPSRPSLRVLRTLTFNPRWAAKLAKQRARQQEKERAQAEHEKAKSSVAQGAEKGKNPFSMANAGGSAPSGGGLFGGDSDEDEDAEEEDEDDEEEAEQAERLAEELQIKATLDEHRRIRADRRQRGAAADGESDDQAWPDAADVLAYRPPQYLNTIPEPYAEDEDEKAAAAKAKAAGGLDTGSGGKGGGGSEGYERQLLSGITSTFERFVERVRREPSQVLRYAWDGQPLPYANKLAFGKDGSSPAAEASKKKVTVLDPPPCERCGAPRTFELQLMPNLINLLKPSTLSGGGTSSRGPAPSRTAMTQQEMDAEAEAVKADVGYTPLERAERARQREIARALGRAPGLELSAQAQAGGGSEIVGLGWATAWVYVCSEDCCRPSAVAGVETKEGQGEGEGNQETWAEEWVALEFEQL
ncbi:hypothetical protein OC835_005288 [Tilletia horrida]|nr:hypothetical protein OC835_005288 [Tilletia horrida]